MPIDETELRQTWDARKRRHRRAQKELLRIVRQAIEDLSSRHKLRPVASVGGKPKKWGSFRDKAVRFAEEGRVFDSADCYDEIRDIVRARVICQTLSDVKRMQDLLDESPAFLPDERGWNVKDRTKTGYRAVHVNATVDVTEGTETVAVPCELQIQTALQLAWGMYTHKDFYKGADLPNVVREIMIQLSDMLSVADHVADELIREVEALALASQAAPAAEPLTSTTSEAARLTPAGETAPAIPLERPASAARQAPSDADINEESRSDEPPDADNGQSGD
jgi:ppGpp synthetase/RelA/SpoT-type nucleotidyltranferase